MTRIFNHRIKRIIDHRTYNTETAMEIAGSADRALFKTRKRGDYFVAYCSRYSRFKANGDPYSFQRRDLRPVTLEQAKSWLREHSEECELLSHDDLSEYRGTLRMTSDLKIKIDALAKRRGQSVNAWIVRWLETGVSVEEEGTQHLAAVKQRFNEYRSRSQTRIREMEEELKGLKENSLSDEPAPDRFVEE